MLMQYCNGLQLSRNSRNERKVASEMRSGIQERLERWSGGPMERASQPVAR